MSRVMSGSCASPAATSQPQTAHHLVEPACSSWWAGCCPLQPITEHELWETPHDPLSGGDGLEALQAEGLVWMYSRLPLGRRFRQQVRSASRMLAWRSRSPASNPSGSVRPSNP